MESNLLPVHVLAAAALTLVFLGLCLHPYRFLVNRAFIFCGKISYSTYLLHTAVLKSVELWITPRLIPFGLPAVSQFLITTTITIVLTLIAAFFTYSTIEKPFIALSARLVRELEARKGSASGSVAP